ncbi:MAG: (Fe-S)-binding protein [Deltaproteobacteria bacterium]|nr:(Fe-S)-binding protein [Deltaproteobacteria bacterium]
MILSKDPSVDVARIKEQLSRNKAKIKLCLAACASCSLCAESCFLFMNQDQDPQYMPSFKVIKSLGILFKKGGRVSRAQLENMRDLVWKNCVLCSRCYCALGIDIPSMISLTRSILRSQGFCGAYPRTMGAPEDDYILDSKPAERSQETQGEQT